MAETAVEPPATRRFSLAHLVLVVPWVALAIDAWAPIRDNSFLWHIRAGELQLAQGEVLVADPFSFTAFGEPWLTQSWLSELLYAWGESNWGLGFVPPMLLLLSSITFLGVALAAYRRSRSISATAIVLLLTTMLMVSFLVPRPVIFSFALFALVIVAWDRPAARWTLPLLFWIWASVHGSFVIGLAYVGLTIIAEAEWKALPTAVVAGLSTFLTAHGLGVLRILFEFTDAGPALALLTEWRRPELLSIVFTPFLVGVGVIIVGAVRGRVTPRHLWILVPFLLLAFSATRAVPPAWIALVPLIGTAIAGVKMGERPRFSQPAAIIFTLFVLVGPFLLVSGASIDDERFPVAASVALEDVPTFHDDVAGGYLIWSEGPERLVFLDDRAELYGGRLGEFVEIRDLDRDWRPVFERDGIEQVLLKADEELLAELATAGWSTAYEDEFYVVMRP
jgi:hypothetical protein